MHGLAQLVLAAATLVHMAAAIPYDKRAGTFSVQQQLNEKYVRNGPAVYAQAFAKFNKPVPADLAKAVSGDGSVTATPAATDTEYICPVTIGGQDLQLNFDTGSADLSVLLSTLAFRKFR